MRVLVIGASGQLGTALVTTFSRGHEIVQAVHHRPGPGQLSIDLADPASIQAVLEASRPELVLIAGAFCHVDRCETEWEACSRVNVDGPRLVAEFARTQGARAVYYSTDHLYDGTSESSREDDAIHPLNKYALSKAHGEAALREVLPDRHLILRAAWVYGPDPQRRNFALRLVGRVAVGEPVIVPADQWGSPTYTEDLALATRYLVERGLAGTFHATGPELVDRASLARRICRTFGLDTSRIVAKPTNELGQAAPRPLRVRLDCTKLAGTGAPPFRGVDAGLAALRAWHVAQEQATGVGSRH